jgi:hypothetical protein
MMMLISEQRRILDDELEPAVTIMQQSARPRKASMVQFLGSNRGFVGESLQISGAAEALSNGWRFFATYAGA